MVNRFKKCKVRMSSEWITFYNVIEPFLHLDEENEIGFNFEFKALQDLFLTST